MVAIACECTKCKMKYVMYIPNHIAKSKKKMEELAECACGNKMKTKSLDYPF